MLQRLPGKPFGSQGREMWILLPISHLPGLHLGRRAGGDWAGEDLGCEWMAHSHVIEASPTVSCSQHLRPALSSTLHILVFPHQRLESTHLPCNYLDSGHSCDDSPSHLANSFQNSITHLLAPAWPPARRVTGNIRLEPHFPTLCISATHSFN